MLTLALDTTAEFGSIALVEDDDVREELLFDAPDGFSAVLFAHIEALLARQAIRLEDVGMFAAASGPGSFTGVRVGLAAVKGLAEVMGKPAAGISNLEVLADCGKHSGMRAVVIDARRGEVFTALFDSSGEAVIPESVLPFQKFLTLAGEYRFEWVSTDFEPFRSQLVGTAFESYPVTAAPRALASAIARIAMRRAPQNVAAIEANYVRRPDAEMSKSPWAAPRVN